MSNKTETLRVRVSPETKALYADCADKLGISLSAFVLFTLSEKCGELLADKLLEKK